MLIALLRLFCYLLNRLWYIEIEMWTLIFTWLNWLIPYRFLHISFHFIFSLALSIVRVEYQFTVYLFVMDINGYYYVLYINTYYKKAITILICNVLNLLSVYDIDSVGDFNSVISLRFSLISHDFSFLISSFFDFQK